MKKLLIHTTPNYVIFHIINNGIKQQQLLSTAKLGSSLYSVLEAYLSKEEILSLLHKTKLHETAMLATKALSFSLSKYPIEKMDYFLLIIEELPQNSNFDHADNYLANIIRYSPGYLYLKNTKLQYVLCNENFAKAAGFSSAEEIIGKTDYDLVWGKTEAELFRKGDIEALSGIKKINFEEPQFQADGKKRTVLANKVPLYDSNNTVIGILGNYLDISKQKQLETDLMNAKIKAESANYIMTEFISNMGHDITTPLSDIGGVAEMFKIYSDEYPELRDLIEALVNRYAACEKVKDRIVDATSLSNLEVKYEIFSITQVLLGLEKELKPSIGTKKLKMIFYPVKPKKEDVIETDYEKFKAILSDFISNAINFTEEGTVSISVEKEGNLFHIKVSDTGIGIPSDKFDYIFQQYTKLSRSNKYGANFKGVGAGLYLSKMRANILNASISVESEVNKGSTFTLSIPAHPTNNG